MSAGDNEQSDACETMYDDRYATYTRIRIVLFCAIKPLFNNSHNYILNASVVGRIFQFIIKLYFGKCILSSFVLYRYTTDNRILKSINSLETELNKRESEQVEDGDERSVQRKGDINECKDQALLGNDEECCYICCRDDNSRKNNWRNRREKS